MTQPSKAAMERAKDLLNEASGRHWSVGFWESYDKGFAIRSLARQIEAFSEAARNILLNLPAWFQVQAPATYDAIRDWAQPHILPEEVVDPLAKLMEEMMFQRDENAPMNWSAVRAAIREALPACGLKIVEETP